MRKKRALTDYNWQHDCSRPPCQSYISVNNIENFKMYEASHDTQRRKAASEDIS